MYGIGVVAGLIHITDAGTPTGMDAVAQDPKEDLVQRKKQKKLLNNMNRETMDIELLFGGKESILNKRLFVYHLTDGIIEILDWDRNKIWCRGLNSVSQYTINSNAWNIIHPLTEEQKKWLMQNTSQ
jgi:hypothetical protein